MPRVKAPISPQELLKKVYSLYHEGKYTESLKVALEGVQTISEAPFADKQFCELYNLIGLSYYNNGQLVEAEQNIRKSLEYALKCNDEKLVYIRYENLAAISSAMHRYQTAIEHLQKAIDIKEKGGHFKDIGRSMIQLAGLQSHLEDFTGAEKSLSKAKEFLLEHKQTRYLVHWYFSSGRLAELRKDYKPALDAYKQAVKLGTKGKEWLMLSRTLSNIGCVQVVLENHKQAEEAYHQSLEIAQKHNMKADEVHSLVSLAEIALNRGDMEKANQLISATDNTMEVYGNEMTRKDALKLWAQIHEKEGNYPASLASYKKYIDAHHTFYNSELNKTTLQLQARYENEKKERELQQAKLQRTESELKALRAQMNPHFIFNALSSIRKAFFEGNLAVADKYMVRFSRLLRLILDSTRTPLMRLNENIEMLELYMQIEQARQNNGFTYAIELPKTFATETIYVPGMLLQPIVENSIVHGLFAKSDGKGKLTVTFSKAGNKLKVAVTDNGVGRSAASDNAKAGHVSHATSIIKETLALAWKETDGSKYLKITDRVSPKGQAAGTRVEVTIPANLKP